MTFRHRSSVGSLRAIPRAALTATILAALAACGGEKSAEGDAPKVVGTKVDLTIGEEDGADEYTFARLGGLAVDSGGRMFVVDNGAHTVRVFGADGKFRYAIGRQGQGPGELIEPCCIALRGDTLWVRNNGNNRYELFVVGDTGATPMTSVRMAHRDQNRWAPVTFDPAGNVIDIGLAPSVPGGADEKPPLTRFHLDRSGRVVAQQLVPDPPEDSTPVLRASVKVAEGTMTRFIYPPYPPLALRAHSPFGEHARAVSSRYSIGWFASDGSLLRTITGMAEAPALTAPEAARAESSLIRDTRWLGSGAKNPYSVPAHKQPLRNLYFDLDGRLWVELSVPLGASHRADVYDRSGRLTYKVEWPANIDLAGGIVTGTTGYAVLTDSLDVQRVVRLKIR